MNVDSSPEFPMEDEEETPVTEKSDVSESAEESYDEILLRLEDLLDSDSNGSYDEHRQNINSC